ncbi:MAG: cadmium-translocating P-type ATPase [Proteobacteria bacterium]|nr:cadmium-translocating P-type ATPase [Pseudomonadota bacterium]
MPAERCWHCTEPLPAGDAPRANIGGAARSFCCHGCRNAAEWIEHLGLADYYRLREQPAQRPAAAAVDTADWQRADLTRHVVRSVADGQCEAMLLVDGIHCSACVWLIERAVGAVPGVARVQVNAAARRARIRWDPARCDLPGILAALARMGYQGLPLDRAALEESRRGEARLALKRLLVAGFGAMQAMMYASALYLGAFQGMDATTRDLFRWLGLLVATPVVFYAARPFFAGAQRSLRAGRPGMDVPVALAISLIYLASFLEALRGGAEVYFDSVSMFVFFLLVGRYLEMRARHRAGDLGDALARLTPLIAERLLPGGRSERVAAATLGVGDLVQVATGSTVPADGILESGHCRVDESLLSGEAVAVARRTGAALIAGSLVVQGPVRLRVTQVGADTVLAGILALVARAQSERPRLAEAGERAAAGFVARVLALAALTAVGWSFLDPARAFTATLAVLVVSCPCALALAVPAALTRALAVLARRGVLVVRPDAIAALAGATHIVFDKTGTLTSPEFALERIGVVRADSRAAALALAAALARNSRHPLAAALSLAGGGLPALPVSEAREVTGCGIEGRIEGRKLRLGRADFALGADPQGVEPDDAVVLADADGVIATFHLAERLRADAPGAISALRAAGLEVEIASGDAPARVAAVAARLRIRSWRARQSPHDKLARLGTLRAQGARVVAVGDGVNDAPVLAGADIAVAMAGGAELAQASSDIVLRGARLGALAEARALAADTMRVLRQNQRWALCYNLTAIPFAALGFVPPWLAALGMSVSSLVVVLNALRIGRAGRGAGSAARFMHEALT